MKTGLSVTLLTIFVFFVSIAYAVDQSAASLSQGVVAERNGGDGRDYPPTEPPANNTQLSEGGPELVVNNNALNEWTLGAGRLFYANRCPGDEFREPGWLRMNASSGGSSSLLNSTTPAQCINYRYMAADGNGLFYFNDDAGQINRYAYGFVINLASIAETAVSLAIDDQYVYWVGANNTIRRLSRGGGVPVTIANTSANPTDIAVSGNNIWWIDSVGLRRMATNCSPLPCTAIQTPVPGAVGNRLFVGQGSLAIYPTSIYWRDTGAANERIRRYRCALDGSCSVTTVYTANSASDIIGEMTAQGANLYWMERIAGEGRLRRSFNGGAPTNIALGSPWDLSIGSDAFYVYFRYSTGIGRLPLNAAALVRDLSFTGWEVTQGIQRPANDVPLVANRPTYVRVYGSLGVGLQTNRVAAELRGWRGATSLGALQPINASQSLAVGGVIDRADIDDGWLFELPPEWITAGNLTLRAVVDPANVYDDNNLGNNQSPLTTFTFNTKPDICVITMPVLTHTPLPGAGDPNFAAMVERFTSLMPTARTKIIEVPIPVLEFELCPEFFFFGIPCFGPFELDQEEIWPFNDGPLHDRDTFMVEMVLLYVSSAHMYRLPGLCGLSPNHVHYMGMVHPDAPTAGVRGYANKIINTSFVVSPERGPAPTNMGFAWPPQGSVMAQELVHNYDRGHIGCGDTGDHDSGFPYDDPCTLDNPGPAAHYGFDTITLQAIAPESAADFMTYGNPRWVSDYTYKGVYNQLPLPFLANQTASSGHRVLVVGLIEEHENIGKLSMATVLPGMAMNQIQANHSGYHLQLLDSGGALLHSEPITLAATDAHGSAAAEPFFLSFNAPDGPVAELRLVDSVGAILDSWTVGPTPPTVTLLSPTGGESFTDMMPISWTSSDADGDMVYHTIHYSPDEGASWHVIATNIINPNPAEPMSLTLDAAGLNSMPGASGTGWIRITASDGYNTTIVTSPGFSLSNRPPRPFITLPTNQMTFAANAPVLLRGGAQDAELGVLADSQLGWALNGNPAAHYGRQVAISGLRPGAYTVELAANDGAGNVATETADFHIAPLDIPQTTAPTLDGYCHDNIYSNVPALKLKPYPDGSQAVVRLTRTAAGLWLCFEGLQRDGVTNSNIEIDINRDNSQHAVPQPDDYAFLLFENGLLRSYSGDGGGGFGSAGPNGFQGQVVLNGNHWQAEVLIETGIIGGWNKQVTLALSHYQSFSVHYSWPYAAHYLTPLEWGAVNLGVAPTLTAVSPASATTNSGGFTLALEGANFVAGDTVLFNGVPLATTFVNNQQLTASVPGGQLTTAAIVDVVVRSASSPDFTSAPQLFTIGNPTPLINSLSPETIAKGEETFTLTVHGSGFVAGADVLWNGTPLPTTYINGSRLEALVDTALLQQARTVGIVVHNPTPGGGSGNVSSFSIGVFKLYLPFTTR
jgi:hypothetical protein